MDGFDHALASSARLLRGTIGATWMKRSNIIEAIEHESKTSIFQLLVELGGNGDGRASLLKNWFCPSYLSSFDSSQVSQAHFDLSSMKIRWTKD